MRQNLLHAAFPNDDHAPAEAAELLAGTLVALDVARELRLPKFAARLRRRSAHFTCGFPQSGRSHSLRHKGE